MSHAGPVGLGLARALMMPELRTEARQRVFKAGKIIVKQGASVFDCVVRNLSDTGASVDLGSTAGVPDTFVLICDSGRISRPCQVVWRTDRRIGLRFAEANPSDQSKT
jgi:hypothetical protein